MTPTELNKMLENYSPERIQKIISTIERDEAQMAALSGKNHEEMLKLYMDCRAHRSPEIKQSYKNNPSGKTIQDCYRYLEDKIRKMSHGQGTMVASTTVFGIVEDYFLRTDIPKFEEHKPASPSHKSTVRTSSNTRQKAEEWERQHKESIDNWETVHNAKIDEWTRKHKDELFYNPLDNPHIKEENPYLKEKNPYLNTQEENLPEQNNTKNN